MSEHNGYGPGIFVLVALQGGQYVEGVIQEPKGPGIPYCCNHRDCLVWPEVFVPENEDGPSGMMYWVGECEMTIREPYWKGLGLPQNPPSVT